MKTSLSSEFGFFRSFFWPIHRHEVRKLVPMLIMLFLICFSYSVLRNMKDSILINTAGAQVLPFVKFWAILPAAIILTGIFTKLTSRFSQERVFYIMISGFMAFFALFAFVLYPNSESLHLHATADALTNTLPIGFKGFIDMIRYWTFTSFYVISELWSAIVMTVLFWGFANEITKISEARRFYGVLSVGSNISAIIAGLAGIYCSFGQDEWEQTMTLLISLIIVAGIATMGIFWWMNRNVLDDPTFQELHQAAKPPQGKKKISMRESFSYLYNSNYLLCIAVLVVGYNLSINLIEIVWKDQLRVLYPSKDSFNVYMSSLTVMVGIFSTMTALFMPKIIERFGWTATALITPFIMLTTSIGFFAFFFFQDSLAPIALALNTTPLAIAVFFGGAQNCLSKASKYSVFDTTKEMAYIPLDHASKLKGKAAIDGVGSRFAKSGGSLIHQGLLLALGTIRQSASFVAVIMLIAIGFWIFCTRLLGKQFHQLVVEKEGEDPVAGRELDSTTKVQPANAT